MTRDGSHPVTIRDVAARAGVSFKSVSNVINDRPYVSLSLRQRVQQAIAEMGYRPHSIARSLARRRSNILGLVLRAAPADAHSDPFLSQFLLGACDAAGAQGFGMLVHILPTDEPIRSYMALFDHRQVDGLIVLCPRIDDICGSPGFEGELPAVRIGQVEHQSDGLVVDNDDRRGSFVAVSHLITLGHRRIGMIANADPAYTVAVTRTAGYRQALDAHGLPFDSELFTAGHFTQESGYHAMSRLLDLPRPPSATFVSSDLMALGAMCAIRDRGLCIPHDMAIVGYDDLFVAEHADPPLTSVRVSIDALSTCATQMLIGVIQGKVVAPQKVILPTELIIRGSCGASPERRWAPARNVCGHL